MCIEIMNTKDKDLRFSVIKSPIQYKKYTYPWLVLNPQIDKLKHKWKMIALSMIKLWSEQWLCRERASLKVYMAPACISQMPNVNQTQIINELQRAEYINSTIQNRNFEWWKKKHNTHSFVWRVWKSERRKNVRGWCL